MPIYEYRAKGKKSCPHCAATFEVVQRMTEPPLVKCPECTARVERILSSPSVHGVGAKKNLITTKNLAEKGFTKYVKAGDGVYEKQCGKGPRTIHR